METIQSFAPLAARLAARAEEIRPVDGAEVSWANFMALFVCAILEMLIALCEALDARAAAVARSVAVPVARDGEAGASRSGCRALPGGRRPTRLTLVPQIQATAPKLDAVLSGTAEPTPGNSRLAWALHPGPNRTASGPPWRSSRETGGLAPGIMHAHYVAI